MRNSLRLYLGWFSILLLLLAVPVFAQPELEVLRADNEAIQRVAEQVSDRGSIHFRAGVDLAPEEFLQQYQQALGLTARDVMSETLRQPIPKGGEVVRFRQLHRGIPVEGAEYLVRIEGGELRTLKGRVAEGLAINVDRAMPEKSGLAAALEHVDAQVYAWENPNLLHPDAASDLESALPRGQLIIVRDPQSDDRRPSYLLAWRFDIKTAVPYEHWIVYVDAESGELVKVLSGLYRASNATGTVVTVYNDTYSFSTRKRGFPNNDYILKDKTRGEITVKHSSDVASWGWNLAGHIDQGGNTWTRREASVHWAVQEAHDYFRFVHGRNGVNGSNEELRVCANSGGTSYEDDGSKSYLQFQTNFEALDVAGHEFTHGVVHHTSGLLYERESGALNESFADIFGTMIEREIVGDANYDWILGGDFGGVRDMVNPNAFFQPETRGGAFWFNVAGCTPHPTLNDFCGVHTNSGVQNRWFSLLVDGGTENGVAVNGVGETVARRIAYRNMTLELFAGADYDDAREGAIDAAEILYGFCSNAVAQVTNAWAAVGVGAPFGNCIPPLSASITGPYTGQPWTPYTFNSSVSGGVPPYTYQWRVNGQLVGTGVSLFRSFADGQYDIELRVTDSINQQRFAWHWISIGTCDGLRICSDLP